MQIPRGVSHQFNADSQHAVIDPFTLRSPSKPFAGHVQLPDDGTDHLPS